MIVDARMIVDASIMLFMCTHGRCMHTHRAVENQAFML